MPNGTKTYQIKINGVQESIDAVKSLNEQLKSLEERIKALESKSIGVKATTSTGGGSKSSSTGSLSEEEKLQKQINQLEEKRIAYSKEIYQNYLAAKDVLSETVKDQKSIAATERLQANAYSNTIQGMKQELADIKAAMQTVDLGDTDQMDKMVQRANELNEALKKIEESYGQFGRNVGHYSSAFDGLDKVRISVGGTVREFGSAKEALKTLNNELKTMAVNGQQDTEAFKALQQKVMELESAVNDAKKPMDNLMDSMESVMAIANLGQGIRALFGIDDSEIQRSIQKLVALQNVMKGIEAINKQIQTREGIGKWIAPLNAGVDAATKKLLTLNTALLGTSKAAKVAAAGINLFSKALKVAVSAGILIAVDLLIEKLMDLVESFKKVDKAAEATKEAEEEVSKAYAEGSATLLKYQTVVKNFNGSKEEEKRLVNELNGELGDSLGTYSSISEWMDVLTKKGQAYIGMLMLQAKAQAAFNNLVKAQQAEMGARNSSTEDYRTFMNDVQDFLWPGWGNKSANNARVAAIQSAKAYRETSEEELTKTQAELEKYMQEHGLGNYAPQIEKNGNKTKDAVKKVDDELIKLRIRNMKEGLNKVITQLEEERKAELRKIEGNSREAGEKRLEINKYYNNRIREEMKKSAENVENLYKSLEKSLHSYQLKNFNSFIEIINKQVGLQKNELQKVYSNILNQGISSYGIQGKSQLSPATRTQLGIVSEDKGEFMEDMKNLAERYRLLQAYENAYNSLLMKRQVLYNDLSDDEKEFLDGRIKATKESLEAREKLYEEYNAKLIDIYGSKEVGEAFNTLLVQENYTERLSTIFHQRYTAYESYWDNVISFVKEASKKEKDYALSAETEEYDLRKDNALNYYNEQLKISNDYYDSKKDLIETEYNKGLTSESEYYDELEKLEKDYEDKQKQLEANYEAEKENLRKQNEQNEKAIEQNRLKKLQDINKEYYEFRLQELRDFQTAIANLENKQPVMNAWGITNFSKTDENNRNLLDSYENLAAQIVSIKEELQRKLKDKEITFDDFQNANRELDSFAENVGQKMDKVKYELSFGAHIQKFIQDFQVYLNEAMNSFQTIMDAVWQAQDNAFDDEQDELDKWNEELDKKLDEQQEIVEKHKDAIDSIEEELSNARGERRQHLIDQLNAEMQAQRAAAAQEKKIQREKEAAQKKQDELDIKRKKAQYNRDKLQAIVNGAMAVTMAAMNNWPIPAIPMMALAAATTAAQIAIISSNKPYRVGGQLEGGLVHGKRHSQGGVPVGNTGIEVEGDEMIIRRESTMPNIDLLNYINKSQRKLNLDDFIDFYSSGKLKKNISSMSPKTAFADGGVIPTISNDIDINDRLVSAMEAYAERPVVVSVVDINNRQNAVKNVQVLAGLSD